MKEFNVKKYKKDIDDGNGVIALQKALDDTYEVIDSPVYIEHIIDIIRDEEEINKIEEAARSLSLNTEIITHEVKQGDYLYITALLRKNKKNSMNSTGSVGVLKVRVVEIYKDLNILKKI